MTEYFDSIAKRIASILLTLAVSFALFACADIGERDNPVDPGYKGDASSVKYGSLTDSRDGQVYKTVTIGTQTWMAENLKYKTSGSYCYGDNAGNCSKYGRLYEWSAAMEACPTGWHLPNDEEWNTLWDAVGAINTAGSKLKSTSGWFDNGNGTDSFGFAVLPAGYRYDNGSFSNEGDYANFWSSTEYNSYNAYFWYFCYYLDGVLNGWDDKDGAFSVRCLRDSDEGSGASSSSSQAKPSSSSSSVILSESEGSSSSSIKYGSLTDSRDNKVYKTVTIGTQTWMAENLNYAYTGVKYNYDGYSSDSTSWCYDNNASNCDKYGRLYTWSAVMDSAAQFSVNAGTKCGYGKTCTPNSPHRGICPEGWHVPKNEEYSTLYTYIGGTSTAGSLLKSTSGWGSGNGTDKYGFSVLPAGYRGDYGIFYEEGNYAGLWSASENYGYDAWRQDFYYHGGSAYQYGYNKGYGLSLRCLKDSSPTSGAATSSSSRALPTSSSSSVAVPDTDPELSSSSAKSNSSIASSSSVVSSSSVASSSSMKAAWTYLNPSISYGEIVDSRDGQVYKTVTIGTQTWMAENLNYAYTGVKYNYSSYTSDSTSWCYENKASNCDKYGRLYTWSAVMDSAAQFNVNAGTKCGYGKTCTPNSPHRGICPEGWHVPTKEEYSTLYTYIGFITAGSLLKSTSGWDGSGNGTDKYGFSVLPAGYRDDDGDFGSEGSRAYLWSASESYVSDAWAPRFSFNGDYADQNYYYKYYGQSLRCLKDS